MQIHLWIIYRVEAKTLRHKSTALSREEPSVGDLKSSYSKSQHASTAGQIVIRFFRTTRY